MKKQLPLGVRILLAVLSVILCIALFVSTVATILVADLSLLTSKGGIQKLIKDVIFPTSAPGHISAAVMPGRNPVRMDAADDAQDAVIDAIYDMVQQQFGGELPLKKEDVKELIEQSTVPDYLADKVSGIISDVISGEITTVITKEEITDLIVENKELLEDTFHMEFTPDIVDEVGQLVEEMDIAGTAQQAVSNAIGVPAPSPVDPSDPAATGPSAANPNKPGSVTDMMDAIGKGEAGVAEVLTLVRFLTSKTVLFSCIGACLLLFALLFLTNWGRPNAALVCCGIPVLLAGSLFLIPTLVAYIAPTLFLQLGLAGSAIRQALVLVGYVSIGVTVLGILLIVGGCVLGSILKKRRARAAVEAPAAAPAVEVHAAEEAPAAETAEEAPSAEEAPAAEEVPVAAEPEN